MKNEDMRRRTKQFALRVLRMFTALPKSTEAQVLGKQVLRSGTSVAANYREACRARSTDEFIAKMGIVEQELDETSLWFELLVEGNIVSEGQMRELLKEADELIRMVVSAIRSAKVRR